MVICLFGESCTGKSTIAAKLAEHLNGERIEGKDYLRFAKNEADARRAFSALLLSRLTSGQPIIYVASEPEQLSLLPAGAFRVRIIAGLPRIKERFATRMGGRLPPPVAAMLERKHGLFDTSPCALQIDTDAVSAGDAADAIRSALQL